MFAIALLPLVLLWGAENHAFFERLTAAEWDYLGPTQRQPGPQADGAYALTIEADGETFVLFKQRPPGPGGEPERTLAGAD